MYKIKFKSFTTMVGFVLLFAKCTTSDNSINFASTVNLKGSSIEADQTNTTLYFSIDNGVTFAPAMTPKVGQKYLVKVMDNTTGLFLTGANFFSLDWSASNPKPDNATADTPGFTLTGGANNIKVSVVDKHCAYTPSSWLGTWTGAEGTVTSGGVGGPGSNDLNHITQDPTNPNKFIMDNFFGDGVSAYFILSPSTTAYDQILTLPTQSTADPGVASGTGTYDQCRGTFTINTTYAAFGTTFTWTYVFHR